MSVNGVLILFLSPNVEPPSACKDYSCFFSVCLQLELSLLDASGPTKGKGISLDQPETMRTAFEQHNEIIRSQAQEIKALKNHLDSCEEQFKELETDSKQ